jgi:hypothetical protein
MEHEASEREIVQPSQDVGQAFVVACQAAEAGSPGDAALDHPALGQQGGPAPGLDCLWQSVLRYVDESLGRLVRPGQMRQSPQRAPRELAGAWGNRPEKPPCPHQSGISLGKRDGHAQERERANGDDDRQERCHDCLRDRMRATRQRTQPTSTTTTESTTRIGRRRARSR